MQVRWLWPVRQQLNVGVKLKDIFLRVVRGANRCARPLWQRKSDFLHRVRDACVLVESEAAGFEVQRAPNLFGI